MYGSDDQQIICKDIGLEEPPIHGNFNIKDAGQKRQITKTMSTTMLTEPRHHDLFLADGRGGRAGNIASEHGNRPRYSQGHLIDTVNKRVTVRHHQKLKIKDSSTDKMMPIANGNNLEAGNQLSAHDSSV